MMLASPVEWAFGVTAATVWSAALLAVPAVMAVRRLVARRLVSPLPRGALERNLVFIAALLGAVGALATSDGIAITLYSPGAREAGTMLAAFIAPVPLAAVPWAAGEILSGGSLRSIASFLAAAATSAVTSWIAYSVLWSGEPRAAITAATVLAQIPAAFLPALLAARTYLAVRGESLDELPAEAAALERL